MSKQLLTNKQSCMLNIGRMVACGRFLPTSADDWQWGLAMASVMSVIEDMQGDVRTEDEADNVRYTFQRGENNLVRWSPVTICYCIHYCLTLMVFLIV